MGISLEVCACEGATLLRCCGNVGIMRGSQAENVNLYQMITQKLTRLTLRCLCKVFAVQALFGSGPCAGIIDEQDV